jgi:hypothetical protein
LPAEDLPAEDLLAEDLLLDDLMPDGVADESTEDFVADFVEDFVEDLVEREGGGLADCGAIGVLNSRFSLQGPSARERRYSRLYSELA